MTAPAGVLDYFALEAGDCLTRIERWATAAERDPGISAADAAQAARALRGAATVARQPEFVRVAAELERALGAIATQGARPDAPLQAPLLDAVTHCGDALRAALRAPRPLPPDEVERLRAVCDALAAVAGSPARPPAAAERVVPIRALARDGDAAFVVHRAPNPPITADHRFRAASVPLARALRQLVADARTATASAGASDAAPPDLARTLGADLRAALADLRELAESYDVQPVATFCAGREASAATLDPRTLTAVDAAAAGLLGERPAAAQATARPATQPAEPVAPAPTAEPVEPVESARQESAPPEPVRGEAAGAPASSQAPIDATERGDAFRPATGEALVALLQTGISGLGHVDTLAEVTTPATLAPPQATNFVAPPAPTPAVTVDGVVPIEHLLYSGPAALQRAREVRDALRARPGAPDPALLAELYDLLDLAAVG